MRKKNFKDRCEKRVIGKCAEVCRTYDPIQYAYADLLQTSDEVAEIRCNVLLDGLANRTNKGRKRIAGSQRIPLYSSSEA